MNLIVLEEYRRHVRMPRRARGEAWHQVALATGVILVLGTGLAALTPHQFAAGCLALSVTDRVVGNDIAAPDTSLVMITGANESALHQQ